MASLQPIGRSVPETAKNSKRLSSMWGRSRSMIYRCGWERANASRLARSCQTDTVQYVLRLS